MKTRDELETLIAYIVGVIAAVAWSSALATLIEALRH
jgi:hypothetical protein